jgi:uncharacterized protein YciI
MTQHFVYKLIPPRPTFLTDMTEAEAAVMAEHAAYWTALRDEGAAVAFGPVADPAGTWGLAVVEAADAGEVDRIRHGDPAVRTGTAAVEVHPMPGAVVRARTGPAERPPGR